MALARVVSAGESDEPLIAPAWVEKVRETIERLEPRAAGGELYARLCLVGWYAERERIERGEIY